MRNNILSERLVSTRIFLIILGLTLVFSPLNSQQRKIELVPAPDSTGKKSNIQPISKPKSEPIKKSFTDPKVGTSKTVTENPTFDGSKLESSTDYTSKYGEPSKTIQGQTIPGLPSNYLIMDYGGFTYDLMIDYLTGNTNIIWHTPFHRAFYFTKPYYVNNPDGTVSIYPPTFSIGKTMISIVILGIIIIAVFLIRKQRNKYASLKRRD